MQIFPFISQLFNKLCYLLLAVLERIEGRYNKRKVFFLSLERYYPLLLTMRRYIKFSETFVGGNEEGWVIDFSKTLIVYAVALCLSCALPGKA